MWHWGFLPEFEPNADVAAYSAQPLEATGKAGDLSSPYFFFS